MKQPCLLTITTCGKGFSATILFLRLVFGGLLLTHGMEKLLAYSELSEVFIDPIGFGSEISLMLVIFAEVVCSLLVILGFFFRLSLLPIIFSLFTAFMYVHDGSIAQGELTFSYLMVFMLLLITGPGNFAFDSILQPRYECECLCDENDV